MGHEKFYQIEDLFGCKGAEAQKELKRCCEWLDAAPSCNAARAPVTTDAMSAVGMRAIQRAADVRAAKLSLARARVTKVSVKTGDLYHFADVANRTSAPRKFVRAPRLGDRCCNLDADGVPPGLRGTVVSVHSHSGCVEVIFDEEFVGGNSLQGACANFRGLLVSWKSVLELDVPGAAAALSKLPRTKSKTAGEAETQNMFDRRPKAKAHKAHPTRQRLTA